MTACRFSRPTYVLVTVLTALAVGGCGSVATDLPDRGRVVGVDRVIDGDTFVAVGGERVRLLTIDAPELNSRTKADDAECGAVVAQRTLMALLPAGSAVALAGLPGEPERDRHGRTLANAYVGPDGLNVGLEQVKYGWAQPYREYPTIETPRAVELADAARAAGWGVWGLCSPRDGSLSRQDDGDGE